MPRDLRALLPTFSGDLSTSSGRPLGRGRKQDQNRRVPTKPGSVASNGVVEVRPVNPEEYDVTGRLVVAAYAALQGARRQRARR